jgi:hypothetical protein
MASYTEERDGERRMGALIVVVLAGIGLKPDMPVALYSEFNENTGTFALLLRRTIITHEG